MLGSSVIQHCALPYTWEELAAAYKYGDLDFKAGGMGHCASSDLKSWLCIRPHPCAENVLDRFCFGYNETSHVFVPLGKNKDLKYCGYQELPQALQAASGTLKLACCDEAAGTLLLLQERMGSMEESIQLVNASLAEVSAIIICVSSILSLESLHFKKKI
jgi:hypothetical protein